MRAECQCTNSFTCGYCCRNAPPWLFTPVRPMTLETYIRIHYPNDAKNASQNNGTDER